MTTPPKKLVEFKDIKLEFSNKMILDGVDLCVLENEILVLMGPSGGGKSTLLNIIMGLLRPNSGSVFFKDQDLTKISRSALNDVRPHLGMVYQNAALISSMTVRENIGLPLRELTRKSHDEILASVNEKLEIVGLQDAGDQLPSELSGGMQKRVSLARALIMDPELVLFDEPSAGLDPINCELVNNLIIHLRESHQVTSLVVTHEMESAFAVATRMAFLYEGKIILQGTPDDFKKSSLPYVHKFLASYSEHQST